MFELRKVFLAADYDRKDEIKGYAHELFKWGWVVVSRWHDVSVPEDLDPDHTANQWGWAQQDLADLESATTLILFTGGKQTPGRNTEFGVGLATSKDLYIVGPRESVYHHLGQVWAYETWDKFVEAWVGTE